MRWRGGITQLQAKLGPFVMCKLGQPWACGVGMGFEEGDKFKPQPGEQRRFAAMVDEEITQQGLPLAFAQRLAQHRKGAGEQALQIVEDQLAIHAQPAVFNAIWPGVVGRVAHMRGQRVQLRVQGRLRGHV